MGIRFYVFISAVIVSCIVFFPTVNLIVQVKMTMLSIYHSIKAVTLHWLHSLGYQGEGLGAHSGTRHQLDHHVLAGRLEMDPRHLLQHGGECGHVAALCAGISSRRVQDVSPVHHQQQHVSLTLFLWKKKKSIVKRKTSTLNPHGGKYKRHKFGGAEGRDYSDLPR